MLIKMSEVPGECEDLKAEVTAAAATIGTSKALTSESGPAPSTPGGSVIKATGNPSPVSAKPAPESTNGEVPAAEGSAGTSAGPSNGNVSNENGTAKSTTTTTQITTTVTTKTTTTSANGTVVIRASYSTIRTGIIRLTPESMKCKLYCKGATCRYCTPAAWPAALQALDGLYSSWVVPERILAMARPTAAHFDDHALLEQFRANGIGTVLNLQCGGEHAFCGPALHTADGFTYDPEFLMRNKLYYYNYAIPDFEPGSVEMILDIIKVIHFSLEHGKVAIHCHAGLGRTGTLIACYLVWSTGCTAHNAIDTVRRARPNSIQSMKQIDIVVQMERMLRQLAAALPYPPGGIASSDGAPYVLPLSKILANQRRALPNEEARKYSHVPKLMFLVCDRLLKLVFEDSGVQYSTCTGVDDANRRALRHNVRACTFGALSVNWRNAFTHKGRAHVRYIMNLFVRLSAFPYDVDDRLRSEFRRCSLVGTRLHSELSQMDASQLVHLLNACLESVQRPYCSNAQLIRAMEWFAPRDAADTPPPAPPAAPCDCGNADCASRAALAGDEPGGPCRRAPNPAWSRARIPPKAEVRTVSMTLRKVHRNNSRNDPDHCAAEDEKRRVDINEDWHCMVFHLLNVLSYLSGENYDVLTDLISYWLTGDAYADVKAAVYCHMRELFARNMHQQDMQAAQYRRQAAVTNGISPSSSRMDLLSHSVGAITLAPTWNFL